MAASVEDQLRAIAQVHDLLGSLETRLQPVLTPRPANPSEATKPREIPPLLHDRLNEHTQGIERASDRIRNILDCLTL